MPFSHIFKLLLHVYLLHFVNGGHFSDLSVFAGIGTILVTCIGHTFLRSFLFHCTVLFSKCLNTGNKDKYVRSFPYASNFWTNNVLNRLLLCWNIKKRGQFWFSKMYFTLNLSIHCTILEFGCPNLGRGCLYWDTFLKK